MFAIITIDSNTTPDYPCEHHIILTLIKHSGQVTIKSIQKTTEKVKHTCLCGVKGHVVERNEGKHHPQVVCGNDNNSKTLKIMLTVAQAMKETGNKTQQAEHKLKKNKTKQSKQKTVLVFWEDESVNLHYLSVHSNKLLIFI